MDIKSLNDRFRKSFSGGRVILTDVIHALNSIDKFNIIKEVMKFNEFTESNDPYNEHDFGKFKYKDYEIMWKIDYYDKSLMYASDNSADDTITTRVMTIMLAEEY